MVSNSKKNSRKSSTQNDVSTVILNGVLTVIKGHKEDTWVGTMTELNSALVKVLGRRVPQNWPGSPSALRVVLNRTVNRLRNRKVSVRFGRTSDHTRTRYVEFVTR